MPDSSFKPLSGIFYQQTYTLRLMPLTIKLSLVDDPLEPIVSNLACANSGFTNANAQTTWQIQNVQEKCDIIALDSGPHESYMKLLAEGKN